MIIRNANESFSPRKITYTEQQVKHSDVSVSENQTLMTAKVQQHLRQHNKTIENQAND